MLAEMHAETASPCSMRTHALALMQPPGDIHVRVGGHAAIRLSCISTTFLMGGASCTHESQASLWVSATRSRASASLSRQKRIISAYMRLSAALRNPKATLHLPAKMFPHCGRLQSDIRDPMTMSLRRETLHTRFLVGSQCMLCNIMIII